MGIRGRKSAASLSTVVVGQFGNRPEPPAILTERQAEEWRAIVARMPADWFTRETHQLLSALCRHVENAEKVAARLDEFDVDSLEGEDELRQFDKLSQILEREQRAASSLATRMRLTQHARYTDKSAHTAAGKSQTKKPWEA